MPHVIVKLWPGKTEKQKQQLADEIVKSAMKILDYGDEAFSVSFEEIRPSEWKERVYEAEIKNGHGKLYKKPGYQM
jgi:4-oxalocrotonate tautomerase